MAMKAAELLLRNYRPGMPKQQAQSTMGGYMPGAATANPIAMPGGFAFPTFTGPAEVVRPADPSILDRGGWTKSPFKPPMSKDPIKTGPTSNTNIAALVQSTMLDPMTERYFRDQLRNFQMTRGRAPDQGEMMDLIADARRRGSGEFIGTKNLTPQQAAYYQDQLGNFTRTRGRAPDQGELEDLIADARSRGGGAAVPAPRQQSQVTLPWQINPIVWDSMGKLGQDLALSFAEDAGWDASDYVRQHMASRPQGQAQRNVATLFQQPRGIYGR